MIQGNTSSLKELAISMGYWIFVSTFYLIIRYVHPESHSMDGFGVSAFYIIKRGFLFGSGIGLFHFLIKELGAKKNLDQMPYGKLILMRNLTYIGLGAVVLIIATLISVYGVYGVFNREEFRASFFTVDTFVSIFSLLVFAGLFDLLGQVANKFGRNNFWRMIIGRYHSPKEEEKIFMFLDLQSSTTIAEEIGHKKYSEFIQECFKDITIIGDFGGEVYQYVGDEAVFTWDARKKNATKRSIESFYAFQNKIQSKKEFYKDKFGHVPLFKAGLHGGSVMVAEVGLLKKEIAFHGDTINTAARIQELCNEKGKIFLTSDYFQSMVSETNKYLWEDMGKIVLKGRHTQTRLYHPALVA